jgi:hypothetical protein
MTHHVRLRAAVALAIVLFAEVAFARSLPLPPASSTDAINPTELRMHLEFLASPELGGRYTLSPSIKVAARYLASRLEAYAPPAARLLGSGLERTGLADRTVGIKLGDIFTVIARKPATA